MTDAERAERAERVAQLAHINRAFSETVPHNRELGMEIIEFTDAGAIMSLPWRADLVGNPETGVLHGGAITALMDAACGAAVFMALHTPTPIATLDLRIDYLRPAAPRETVFTRTECYKVTRNVAFVRGVAYHDDESRLIASAAGSFMLGTASGFKQDRSEDGEA